MTTPTTTRRRTRRQPKRPPAPPRPAHLVGPLGVVAAVVLQAEADARDSYEAACFLRYLRSGRVA